MARCPPPQTVSHFNYQLSTDTRSTKNETVQQTRVITILACKNKSGNWFLISQEDDLFFSYDTEVPLILIVYGENGVFVLKSFH